MFFLFLTRLLLYFIAITLPLVHSGISVSYDKISWFIWFGIVPAEFFIALLVKHIITERKKKLNYFLKPTLIIALLLIILPIFFVSGFDSNAWRIVTAGTIAFFVTLCIFLFEEHGYLIALGELFTGGYFYIKLLSFSRASELIATENYFLTKILLAICIVGFLLHSYVLYSSAFLKKKNFKRPEIEVAQQRREWVTLLVLVIPVVLFVILIPPNYIENIVTLNTINESPPSPPVALNDSGYGISGGNLQSSRNLTPTENNRQKNTSKESTNKEDIKSLSQQLEGIPAQEWDKFIETQSTNDLNTPSGQTNSNQQGLSKENSDKNGSGQDNKQYAVMIMSSTKDPVYAANGYYEIYDAQKGFLFSKSQPLNQLVNQRLIETWKNPSKNNDKSRLLVSQTFFSTTSNRALAYLPEEIEPSIQQTKYHPFNLSYRTLSRISELNVHFSYDIQSISNEHRKSLAIYLDAPVHENIKINFDLHLNRHVNPQDDLLSQIEQILKSFSEFQYKIGFTDDVSTNHLNTFLTSTQSGDCTEFSNTVALMGRLIGIPTRVVTGYIGAKSLQTAQHQRGIGILRQDIAPLKDIPVDDLYLITNAHRHSWTQFWIPEFGWVDYESTKYAKQPPPGKDANSLDIVIPIINIEEESLPKTYIFPWKFVSIIFLSITALVISGAYIFRFTREIRLYFQSKQKNDRGLYALINLLYMKMATAGYVLKNPSQTALEYAKYYPEIHFVATNYTMLRYKKDFAINEKQRCWMKLHNEYNRAIKIISPKKIKFLLLNLFSLRSLYY